MLVNYYNPFLAIYLKGGANQQVAQLSSGLQGVLNAAIGYGAAVGGGQVADVAGAYDSLNWFTQVKTPLRYPAEERGQYLHADLHVFPEQHSRQQRGVRGDGRRSPRPAEVTAAGFLRRWNVARPG